MRIQEALAQAYGFTDTLELKALISMVDLSTPEKMDAFNKWKTEDGTKSELLKLINHDE